MCTAPWPLRRKVRLVWWILSTLVLCGLPFTIWEFKEKDYSPHYIGWVVAGIFVLLTLPVSIYQVALHLEYYNQPELQRQVVRIILMVPIYALVSWSCLRFLEARRWLQPLREVYEAVVLYSFHTYLTTYLRLKTGDLDSWLLDLPPQQPLPPLRGHLGAVIGVKAITDGQKFMRMVRKGVLAYVFVRPALALVQLYCMLPLVGRWGEGEFDAHKAWIWCQLINSAAQFWAIYCLIALYHATHEELAPINPLRKFIIIKMVVFFSFWQGFVLSILGYLNVFGDEAQWTTYKPKQVAMGIQDLIICIECLPAALCFAWAFPVRDYMAAGQAMGGLVQNLRNMFDLRDLWDDVGGYVEDQVALAGHMAASSMVEVASSAHAISRQPVNSITKPIKQLASYFPVPVRSQAATLANGHQREEGRVLTPLLPEQMQRD